MVRETGHPSKSMHDIKKLFKRLKNECQTENMEDDKAGAEAGGEDNDCCLVLPVAHIPDKEE